MKNRSIFSFAIAVALALGAAAIHAVERTFDAAADVIADAVQSFRAIAALVVASVSRAPTLADGLDLRESARLTAASAFVLRMIKRQRPRIEAGWSMSPSV